MEKNYLRKKCKYCRNEDSNAKDKRVRNLIDNYKKQNCCAICEFDDYRALVFHHVDKEEKELNIADLVRYSIRKIFEEIAKCVLICANCHSIVHYNERNGIIDEQIETRILNSLRFKEILKYGISVNEYDIRIKEASQY